MVNAKKILTSNLMILIYSLAFIGLTAFSIWDVKNIIIDYILDNRATLVKLRNSTFDGFPFLGQKSSICLWYQTPPFANGIIARDNFTELYRQWWVEEEIRWPKNISESDQADIIDYFHFKTYDYIYDIDVQGPYSATDWVSNFQINGSRANFLFDNYITSSRCIKILKQMTIKVQERLIQHEDDQLKNNFITHDLITYPHPIPLCFYIPLAQDFTISHSSSIKYFLDYVYLENKTDFNTSMKTNQATPVQVFLPERFFSFDKNSNENFEEHTISIANNGVFDSSHFPPCTNFESEGDCLRDIRQKLTSEICDCLQFSEIFKEALSNNDDEINYNRPLCTSKIYENCWKKANESTVRRQEEAKRNLECVPCTSAKRNYVLNTKKLQWNEDRLGNSSNYPLWLPRTAIKFECTDTKFLLYEERPQFSLSQVISQIGGDLGLYIGFSMISLLQLIMFIYTYYMHQKKNRNRNQDQDQDQTQNNGWFRSIIRYIIRSFNEQREIDLLMEEMEKQKTLMAALQMSLAQQPCTVDITEDADNFGR